MSVSNTVKQVQAYIHNANAGQQKQIDKACWMFSNEEARLTRSATPDIRTDSHLRNHAKSAAATPTQMIVSTHGQTIFVPTTIVKTLLNL
jgi:hypothetical protein